VSFFHFQKNENPPEGMVCERILALSSPHTMTDSSVLSDFPFPLLTFLLTSLLGGIATGSPRNFHTMYFVVGPCVTGVPTFLRSPESRFHNMVIATFHCRCRLDTLNDRHLLPQDFSNILYLYIKC
jgi:hypothetical protein